MLVQNVKSIESFVLGHGVGMETRAAGQAATAGLFTFTSDQQADLLLRTFLSDRLKTL